MFPPFLVSAMAAQRLHRHSLSGLAQLLQIGNQPRTRGVPTKLLLRALTRRRYVEPGKHCQPAKMFRRFFRRLTDYRNIQSLTNHFGNLSKRYTFFGNRVITRAGGTFLQREPIKPGRIESMHGRPAIESIAHIRRDTFRARDIDQIRNQALF